MRSSSPLTIWCNAQLPPDAIERLKRGVAPHRLIFSGQSAYNLAAGQRDPTLNQAAVAYGQPDAVQIQSLPRLRWIHITSAGYTRYDNDACKSALRKREAMLTNSSSVYDEPCAQHALAMMLAFSRRLPQVWENQRGQRSWNYEPVRRTSRKMRGQTVLVVGFGAIARRLVQMLAPFDMRIIGVRRKIRGDEPIKMITTEQTNDHLGQADHVVNILPSAKGNERYFDAERFTRMKPDSYFYNIGRGDTVDQEALLGVLNDRRIAGAYLDVTDPEPLPPDHPLWSAPNCYITPHTAGGWDGEFDGLVDHFLDNLKRFTSGEELRDRIV